MVLKVRGKIAEGSLIRLTEKHVALRFGLKVVRFSRYVPLRSVRSLLPRDAVDYMNRSATLHAVWFKGQWLIHPQSFYKFIADKVKRTVAYTPQTTPR